MKRFLLSLLSLTIASNLLAGTSRYLVLMRTPTHRTHARIQEAREFRTIDAFAANLTESEVAELRASGDVLSVETIKERHILGVGQTFVSGQPSPTSSTQDIPYGVTLIHAPSVWPVSRGENVNVAIVDTGIDPAHPDLAANYAGGYNTYTPGDVPLDDNRHGTHVAGIIGAVDNEIGVVGVAPHARIWSVKVLDKQGNGDNEHIAAGIDWVIAKKREVGGNWIISMSFGGAQPSDAEEAVTKRASDEGILLVAAAGNRSARVSDYPAAYPQVMAISAVDAEKNLAEFTSGGDAVSVAAPGVDVLSSVPVGSAIVADVRTASGEVFAAAPLIASPFGSVSGDFVLCGYGQPGDFPASVAGKIAVIRRGEVPFGDKTRNALAAGAKSVIIINGQDNVPQIDNWTLIQKICSGLTCQDDPADLAYHWPIVLAMSYTEGEKLLAQIGKSTITESYRADDYTHLSGTSMATPHVSGAAALLWSIEPSLSAIDIRHAIETTAEDRGAPGADTWFGHGVLDAFAAAERIAPQKFGLAPVPPRRRASGH